MTESAFFQDLAILMVIAGCVAAVFSRLGWPKVIGYILAGILMSEYTWGGSFLSDTNSIRTIAQLGIVFLMFGMGLSFSAKDMRRMRMVAMPAAILDTVMMIWLGYTLGTMVFGWSSVMSIFFGVAICDSATTLLAKVIDDMGWGKRPFAKYVLGTSVCEDIICVGAIAVASGFARGEGMSAGAMFSSIGWLLVFFLSVLVFGFILLPRLLKSVGERKDDESLLLTVLAAVFGISYFAYSFDFSLALGAFLVGIVAASSEVKPRLEGLVDPLKSMFSAMFFVSIGLLVDPAALWHCLPRILLVSLVVVVGKTLNNALASLATGLDIKTAIQNGMSLAQIGEFAFMVAVLYADFAKSNENEMFPIAIGVSLLTTILNPVMIRLSDRVGDLAERRIPARFQEWLRTYRAWIDKIGSSVDDPAFMLFKAHAIKLGIYAVLMLAVSVGCRLLHQIDYSRFSAFFERIDEIVFFVTANLFIVAMMPMVISAARSLGDEVAVMLAGDGNEKWQLHVKQMVRLAVLIAVVLLVFVEWSMINISVLPISIELQGVSAVITLGVGVACWRFFVKAGRRATQRFAEALSAEERREGLVRTTTIFVPEGMVHRLQLGPHSPAIGETVVSLNVRAKTGASIVSVYRGGNLTRNIGPEWEFAVGDVLVALGEQHQISALKDMFGVT